MIATQMYGKPVSELTRQRSRRSRHWQRLLLAWPVSGGRLGASAVAGAQSGKTTVRIIYLAVVKMLRLRGYASMDRHGNMCRKPFWCRLPESNEERDAVGLALATGTVALLPGRLRLCGDWEQVRMLVSVIWLRYCRSDKRSHCRLGECVQHGNGLAGTVGWNAAGGALGNWMTTKILCLVQFQMVSVLLPGRYR